MNLSTEQLETLRTIGHQLLTQDNRCTQSPMFIVQQRREFGVEPGEGDKDVWLDDDWHPVDAETALRLDGLADEFSWDLDEDQTAELKRHTKRGIKYIWEFCMAAFTEEGCKEYLRQNGHNLHEPRIYAESFYRCPEMLAIRKALMDLATEPAATPAYQPLPMTTFAAQFIDTARATILAEAEDFTRRFGHKPNAMLCGIVLANGIVEHATKLAPDVSRAMQLGHIATSDIGQMTFCGFPLICTRPDDQVCAVLLGDLNFLAPKQPLHPAGS